MSPEYDEKLFGPTDIYTMGDCPATTYYTMWATLDGPQYNKDT